MPRIEQCKNLFPKLICKSTIKISVAMSLSLVDKDHIIQMFEYQFWVDMDLELNSYAEAYIGIHTIFAHMCNLLVI